MLPLSSTTTTASDATAAFSSSAQNVTLSATVTSNGLITWVTNPGNGLAITWSGGYYRRCRFDMDEFELEQLVNLCWGNGTLKLISLK